MREQRSGSGHDDSHRTDGGAEAARVEAGSDQPRQRFRLCHSCGQLRPEEALTRVEYPKEILGTGLACETCIENGINEPRFYRRHDGSFVELVVSVWAWCLDCEWETEVHDFPYDSEEEVRTRAKKAGAGHIGNSEGCDDFTIATHPEHGRSAHASTPQTSGLRPDGGSVREIDVRSPVWENLFALPQSVTRGMMEKDTVYPVCHCIYARRADGKFERLCDRNFAGNYAPDVRDHNPTLTFPISERWVDYSLLGEGYSCSDCARIARTLASGNDQPDGTLRTDGGTGPPGVNLHETVTVTFVANYEIDPDDFDLRLRDPRKIRRELASAVIPGFDSLQETLASDEESLLRYRERIEEARLRNNRDQGTGSDRDDTDLRTDGGTRLPERGIADDLDLGEHYARLDAEHQQEYEQRHPDRPAWTDPNVCPVCGRRAPELQIEYHLFADHGWSVIRQDFEDEEPADPGREPPGEQATLLPDGGREIERAADDETAPREWDRRIRSARGQRTFKQAHVTWGYEAQLEQAIEELEELADALETELCSLGAPDHEETIKEIVDVRIMLGQLALYRAGDALRDRVNERMDRLDGLIEDASEQRTDGGTVTGGPERAREIPLEAGWYGEGDDPFITNDDHGRAVLVIPGEYEIVLGARLCQEPPRVDEYQEVTLTGGPSHEVAETWWLLDGDDPGRWVFLEPTLRDISDRADEPAAVDAGGPARNPGPPCDRPEDGGES